MKKNKYLTPLIIASIITLAFLVSFMFLIFDDFLAAKIDVIGIRIAALFIAFITFCSTSLFSYLIYNHNKLVRINNDDANNRAEAFRVMQFASANYSIVDFKDSMTIYKESSRYINKYIHKKSLKFHMVERGIDSNDVLENPKSYTFLTLKVPFYVVEGKLLGHLIFERIKFEREGKSFEFVTPKTEERSYIFLLFNDVSKNSAAIINMVVNNDSDFFHFGKVNEFTKIKINISATSLLGVEIQGITELYFTNPERKEEGGSNTYKINSSNFFLTRMPQISEISQLNN